MSDEEWWSVRAPVLEEMVGDQWPERFPISTRLTEEQVFEQLDRPDDSTPHLVRDALDTFEFGLQRLLDGIEAHVRRPGRAGQAPSRSR